MSQNSSATKFTHDVLDVPFNRAYVSKQMMEQQDVQRIDDALSLVSGVFHQNSFGGGFWDNYSFRGFSTDPNLGASMIRNGLSVNRGISAPKDVVNIESLEFLKGPMAALYGRGETGGLLNLNSKKPQWESESEVNLRANTQEQYRISLEHTAPINDELAYRVAVAHEDNQSFRDHVSSERWFFSPQLTWKISDQTQLDFDSEFTEHKGTFGRGVSTVNHEFVMDPKTFTGEPDDGDLKIKDYFYQLRLSHEFNPDWKLNSA
ncbi:MAG TPA: TonB-dependent siderophore receptor, partial [Acinetobacter nosocomialis]|nr:TonB-dependent siderophore receptor [Acinetobacter nosocomialis]